MPDTSAQAVEPKSQFGKITSWIDNQIDSGTLANARAVVFRNGQTVYDHRNGYMNLDAKAPLRDDAIFRIYSMSKPITAVALMILQEEGKLHYEDAVKKFIPSFADMRVFLSGDADNYESEPAKTDITIKHLLTHTSGLTYAFRETGPMRKLYARGQVNFNAAEGTLEDIANRAGDMPLVAQPGTVWNYSIGQDIGGRIVEVASGQPFDVFLRERIFEPLGMVDTGFHVPAEKRDRLVSNFNYAEGKPLEDISAESADRLDHGTVFSGGGGLASTTADYLRFARMLLNNGELDGVRILTPETIGLMTQNHIGGDMPGLGEAEFSGASTAGIGFGLIGAVCIDPSVAELKGSKGNYFWGGAASTYFWVDPAEAMTVVFMTQLMPSSALPTRTELRALVYDAIDA